MKSHLRSVVGVALCFFFLAAPQSFSATLFERLGLRRATSTNSSPSLASFSTDELSAGLKDALAKGVRSAVDSLGRSGGFLDDPSVRIALPESLHRAEAMLRTVGQGEVVDDFVRSMNRAAEEAVPEATEVLLTSLRQMTLADARAILTSTNTAATDYFRRTSVTNLQERLRPIVERATAKTGVTGGFKAMMGKVPRAASFLGDAGTDLDGYITRHALDGLFLRMSEEEQRIRKDPAARTTELLQRVFGAAAGAAR